MPATADPAPAIATGASPVRVFIHVQGLLGIGHFRRASLVAEALAAAGCEVELVHGGMPVALPVPPGCNLVQLPPLKASDTAFTRLVDADGADLTDTLRQTRRRLLRRHFRRLDPDVLVTEAFPFGRRALRFELEPLLEHCHASRGQRPLVLCSVRDIVQQRPAGREQYTVDLLRRWYDGVLVHADPELVSLDASFGRVADIEDLLHYTGYVSAGAAPACDAGRTGVVVSAGGGAAAARLLEVALAARPQTFVAEEPWLLVTGSGLGDAAYGAIAGQVPAGVTVERHRDDFSALLARCRVSVSQCGYNTTTDLLESGAPAVVVPFEGEGETEQLMRARRLADLGRVHLVRERELDAARLAEAVDRAAIARPPALGLNLGGAVGSARTVLELLAAHRGHAV